MEDARHDGDRHLAWLKITRENRLLGNQNSDEDSSCAGKPEAVRKVTIKLDGLTKAAPHLTKVYDNTLKAITRGVGELYAPLGQTAKAWADRKEANIRAQTLIDLEKKRITLEKLRVEHALEQARDEPTQEERAIGYLIENAVRKQGNREKLVENFVSDLTQNTPTTDANQNIDDDWLTHFWGEAEKLRDDDVRLFYARLLSSEVAKPGTISRLTLRTLSIFTREVAEKFQHFCCLSFDTGSDVFVIHPNIFAFQNLGPLDDYGVSYDDLFEVEAYGLIRSAETLLQQYATDETAQAEKVDYAGQPALLNLSGVQTHELKFTRVGREIRRVLSLNPVPAYTDTLQEKLGSAFVLERNDGSTS